MGFCSLAFVLTCTSHQLTAKAESDKEMILYNSLYHLKQCKIKTMSDEANNIKYQLQLYVMQLIYILIGDKYF